MYSKFKLKIFHSNNFYAQCTFCCFSYDLDVVSVRQGTKIPFHIIKTWTPRDDWASWKCLKVEGWIFVQYLFNTWHRVVLNVWKPMYVTPESQFLWFHLEVVKGIYNYVLLWFHQSVKTTSSKISTYFFIFSVIINFFM